MRATYSNHENTIVRSQYTRTLLERRLLFYCKFVELTNHQYVNVAQLSAISFIHPKAAIAKSVYLCHHNALRLYSKVCICFLQYRWQQHIYFLFFIFYYCQKKKVAPPTFDLGRAGG